MDLLGIATQSFHLSHGISLCTGYLDALLHSLNAGDFPQSTDCDLKKKKKRLPSTVSTLLHHWRIRWKCLPACVCCVCLVAQSCLDSLGLYGLWPTRLLCPWDSPGKNTGVGCHSLLQGIFPTQGSNPSLLNWKRILYHLTHQGSPPACIVDILSPLSPVTKPDGDP